MGVECVCVFIIASATSKLDENPRHYLTVSLRYFLNCFEMFLMENHRHRNYASMQNNHDCFKSRSLWVIFLARFYVYSWSLDIPNVVMVLTSFLFFTVAFLISPTFKFSFKLIWFSTFQTYSIFFQQSSHFWLYNESVLLNRRVWGEKSLWTERLDNCARGWHSRLPHSRACG